MINKSNLNEHKNYEIQIGLVKSHISYREIACLWSITKKRKFSGVNHISAYKSDTINQTISSIGERFKCNADDLTKFIRSDAFIEFFYKTEKIRRDERNVIINDIN